MSRTLPANPAIHCVIPHFGVDERANDWLRQCLASLLAQTVPLQAIIVVDDDSPHSPEPVVRGFPSVSLMRNASNTGPFAILDLAVSRLGADALLLQDSDDWSAPDRLELLLATMRRTQADIVGCQVQMVYEDPELAPAADALAMPRDPRAMLLEHPTAHTMLLPSALLSREFACAIGGFSSGLKFGADSEFVRRAVFGGVARNIDDVRYFRRIHARSLTRAPATGFGSPARLALQQQVQARAKSLVNAYRTGEPLDLSPLLRSPPTILSRVLGPPVPGLQEPL
jgi:glycosyltransferase involved in cell wall biosynthesis